MTTFNIAGTMIGIDGTCQPIIEAIETLFCLCPQSDRKPTLNITGRSCNADRLQETLPDWLASSVGALACSSEPVFIRNSKGAAIIVKQEETGCCAWLSADYRNLQFLAGMREDRLTPLTVQPAIVPLIREFMLTKHQILLHSAAVQCPDGIGVLIAAPGYGGKSTTTMSLVRLGAKLLGDDLTVILPAEGRVQALGIPEPFNLTSQTIEFFPECRGIAEFIPKPNSDGKRVFSPHDIYGPACLVAECPLQVAYFVRISGNGPAVRIMSTIEAMQNFAAAHMFARDQLIDGFSTSRLLDIISQLKVYELQTGLHPDRLGKWLMENAAGHAGVKMVLSQIETI